MDSTDLHPFGTSCGLVGRPRAFDRDAALDAALQVFWQVGYEAASMEMLTHAMAISRSSFYSAFGSKRAVLIEALQSYARRAAGRFAALSQDSDAHGLVVALADPGGGKNGCLLVNCLTELAPRDPEVAALGRAHLARIESILADRLPVGPGVDAAATARALVALAIGTMTLRKSGLPQDHINAVLRQAEVLIAARC